MVVLHSAGGEGEGWDKGSEEDATRVVSVPRELRTEGGEGGGQLVTDDGDGEVVVGW